MFGHFKADANTVFLMNFRNDISDQSGNGNNGTFIGNAALTNLGKFGKGITVDGSGDYVEIADAASLDITGALTIEVWLNKTTNANYGPSVSKDAAGGGNAYQFMNQSTSGRFAGRVGNDSDDITSSNDVLGITKLNRWDYLALVYTGARLELYINGYMNATAAWTTNPTANASKLTIGGRVSGEMFNGQIGAVKISNIGRKYRDIKNYFKSLRQAA